MRERFLPSAKWLLVIEGFWSDDPHDRGRATQHGISLRHLQSLRDLDGDGYTEGDLNRDGTVDVADVRAVNEAEALAILHRDFWRAVRADELPAGLDTCVFGGAVNHGPDRSVRLLQQALRVKVDGLIGPQTLGAAGRADLQWLVPELLAWRARFYHRIVVADASQARFLRGWLRRLFELLAFVAETLR